MSGSSSRYLELLTRRPGLTAREVREALGIEQVNSVQHTLRNLLRAGRVRCTMFPARWFVAEAKERAA